VDPARIFVLSHSGGDTEEARRARKELTEWIRNGDGPMVDLAAAEEVKRLGLIANYDE
jgi:hypothetical protein